MAAGRIVGAAVARIAPRPVSKKLVAEVKHLWEQKVPAYDGVLCGYKTHQGPVPASVKQA